MRCLYFHRLLGNGAITDYSDLHDPTAREFEAFLKKYKRTYCFISSDQLAENLKANNTAWNLIHLSMDDGFASSLLAAEICERHSVPLTVFVTSQAMQGFLPWYVLRVRAIINAGGPVKFQGRQYDPRDYAQALALHDALKREVYAHPPADQQEAAQELLAQCGLSPGRVLDKFRFMTLDELAQLAASPMVTIGGHGKSHVSLQELDAAMARREIAGCRQDLEAVTGREVKYFSYPEGLYSAATVAQVKEAGFAAAFAVAAEPGADSLYAIPRTFLGRGLEQFIPGPRPIAAYQRDPASPLRVVVLTWVPQQSGPYLSLYRQIKEQYPQLVTVGRTWLPPESLSELKAGAEVIAAGQAKEPAAGPAPQGGVHELLSRLGRVLPPGGKTWLQALEREYYRSRRVNRRGRWASLLAAPGLVLGERFQMKLALRVEEARARRYPDPAMGLADCDIILPAAGDLGALARSIAARRPDVIIQLGWGIVPRPLLDIAGWGVLSWHHGMMPGLRGAHTPTWAVAYKRPDWLGLSLQRLEAGMDTGQIVSRRSLDPKQASDYVDAYLQLDDYSIEMTLDALSGLEQGRDIISDPNLDPLAGEYRNIFRFSDILRYLRNQKSFFG